MGDRDGDRSRDGGLAPVVCNASPLIALDQIGQLDLLPGLFARVVVPLAVARETPRLSQLDWLEVRTLASPLPPEVAAAGLGPGEAEAIALSVELGAATVILDERRARALADTLGVQVVGTLGVLVLAKNRGLLPSIEPSINALLAHGFWLAPRVMTAALVAAGERS